MERFTRLWFGPKGTITPLHHDGSNILFGQVYGRKHIKLIDPYSIDRVYNDRTAYSAVDLTDIDYKRFPLIREVEIIDVILEPGQFVLLPIGWWHWVRSLDVSISIGFQNFRFNGPPCTGSTCNKFECALGWQRSCSGRPPISALRGGAMDGEAVEAAVRDALTHPVAPDVRPLLVSDDIIQVASEGSWMAVVIRGGSAPLDQVHRRLADAFPTAVVEVRNDTRVYRGGAGFGERRHVVAVLGGKGGVGKSTTATNLALTLSALGMSTGLLDADLNAPDIPHMLGVHPEKVGQSSANLTAAESVVGQPQKIGGRRSLRGLDWDLWHAAAVPPSRWRRPYRRYGTEVMSIGLAIPEDLPATMTGRLLASALLRHLLFEVSWTADVVLIDAPPGTGPELQVLASELPLSGVVFVTTPQDLAQMDAERTLTLLVQQRIPVIGMVQNMASLVCPHCAQAVDLFARSRRLLEAGVPILGRVPFDVSLSVAADRGQPLVLTDSRGPVAREFAAVGLAVRRWLTERGAPPLIPPP